MAHAEKCPVCNGNGKIKTYLDPFGFGYSDSNKTYTEKTCHSCQGKGWITVCDVYPIDLNKITNQNN